MLFLDFKRNWFYAFKDPNQNLLYFNGMLQFISQSFKKHVSRLCGDFFYSILRKKALSVISALALCIKLCIYVNRGQLVRAGK